MKVIMTRDEEERLKFIRIYADYVLKTPDKVWSAKQKVIINSLLSNANQMSPEEYLKLKGEPCKRKSEKRNPRA